MPRNQPTPNAPRTLPRAAVAAGLLLIAAVVAMLTTAQAQPPAQRAPRATPTRVTPATAGPSHTARPAARQTAVSPSRKRPRPIFSPASRVTLSGSAWPGGGYRQTIHIARLPAEAAYLPRPIAVAPRPVNPEAPAGSSPSPTGTATVGPTAAAPRVAVPTGCSQITSIAVLSTEMTWGAGGPPVPLRLFFNDITNGGPPVDVFGADLSAGMTPAGPISLVGLTDFELTAQASFPTTANPSALNRQIPSSDAVHAMILLPGNNYFTLAAQKGVQQPFGGQLDITSVILASIVDPPSGAVALHPNQMIILYELGAADINSPAADFQDLVLLVDFDCQVVQTQQLRTGIDPATQLVREPSCWEDPRDPNCTNGTLMTGYSIAPNRNAYTVIGHRLNLSQRTVITGINHVGNSSIGPSFWEDNWRGEIHVFGSESAFAATPIWGDVYNDQNNAISLVQDPPAPFVGSVDSSGDQNYFTSFSFAPFVLPPGTYFLELLVETPQGFATSESRVVPLGGSAGNDDIWADSDAPGQWFPAFDPLSGYVTGFQVADILGYPAP